MLNGLNNFPLSLELPYLTSSLGVGFSKSIQKVQNQQIYVPDRGGQKNPTILRTSYMEDGSPLSLSTPIMQKKGGGDRIRSATAERRVHAGDRVARLQEFLIRN